MPLRERYESIAYGYLSPECAEPGVKVEIEHEGERYAAIVREEPRYDPERTKLLGWSSIGSAEDLSDSMAPVRRSAIVRTG